MKKKPGEREKKIISKHADYLLEMMLMADEMTEDWLEFGAPRGDRCGECGKLNFEDDEAKYMRNRSGAMKDKARDIAKKFLFVLYDGDFKKVDNHINDFIREDRRLMKRN